MPDMKIVVAAGFAALIITTIGCTYVINNTIKRYSTSNDEVVSAIEEQGKLTRDAIRGKPEPLSSSGGWPW